MDGEIIKAGTGAHDDLSSLVGELLGSINLKVAALLFLVLVFVNTTVFMERILGKWMDGGQLTERGVIIQSMVVCMIYIVLDMLSNYKCI